MWVQSDEDHSGVRRTRSSGLQLLQRLEELLEIIEDVVAEQKVSQLSQEG